MNELQYYINELLIDRFNVSQALSGFVVLLIVILIWLVAGVALSRLNRRIIINAFQRKKGEVRGKTLGNLLAGVLSVIIWFIVTLAIMTEIGFEITPILAAAGILGLAIGFGMQHLVSDIVSGFFIIMDNAYNLGETIEVDGFKGKVVHMNLHVTHVENFMGSLLIINNGRIGRLINWSRNNTTALVDFGVAYETDLAKVTEIMPELMESLKEKFDDIIEIPSFLGVTELADSSINMRIMAKTKTGAHFATERKIRHELVLFLNKHDIEIPFPQVVVSNKESS